MSSITVSKGILTWMIESIITIEKITELKQSIENTGIVDGELLDLAFIIFVIAVILLPLVSILLLIKERHGGQ